MEAKGGTGQSGVGYAECCKASGLNRSSEDVAKWRWSEGFSLFICTKKDNTEQSGEDGVEINGVEVYFYAE